LADALLGSLHNGASQVNLTKANGFSQSCAPGAHQYHDFLPTLRPPFRQFSLHIRRGSPPLHWCWSPLPTRDEITHYL